MTLTDLAPDTRTVDPALEALLAASVTASRALSTLTTERKDAALTAIADALDGAADRVLPANQRDLQRGRAQGISTATGWQVSRRRCATCAGSPTPSVSSCAAPACRTVCS